MAFAQTLRAVQAARAISLAFACLSVILFSFVIKLRRESRTAFLSELKKEHGDIFDIGEPTHSAWGGLALIGLAFSIAWNGFSFIDLCIRKHYRFDRRICIFVDVVIALSLVVTGFLTFMYDAVLFIALEIASATQVKLEIAATTCLACAGIAHLAFFCYGCKDPNVTALNFEPILMHTSSPNMNEGDYHKMPLSRSRSNSMDSDMDSKDFDQVSFTKRSMKIKLPEREVMTESTFTRTDGTPKTPSEEKRFGLVGLPARLGTPQSEHAPFLKTPRKNDWV